MSYQYGSLTKKKSNSFEGYTGKLTAPFHVGDIWLKPLDKKHSDDSPDYYIMSRQGYPIGKCWEKVAKKTGVLFFSMTFDTPQLERVVYCSAFQDDEDAQKVNIVWNRPKKKDDAQEASKSDNGESLDDEIPF
jgi:uncharacterized protein (DUF736 family)